MADEWSWWRAALANPSEIGKSLKRTTTPEQGFYKTRRYKGAPWEPVAIWFESGEWKAAIGMAPDHKAIDAHKVWEMHGCHPISVEEYERTAERGEEWSDSEPTVANQMKPAKPGDNSGDVDEAEILKDQIESAKQGAGAYRVIKDDETAAKAQSLRSRLLELHREADSAFHAEKDPITKRGKEIDKRWRFRTEAQETADAIRAALKAHEDRKLQERRKAEAVAEAARRREQEEAAKARAEAEAAGDTGEPLEEAPAPAPAPAAPVQTTIKGNYGRAATVKTKWVVASVTDQDALYAYMREHADLKALLFDLAKRAHANGHANIPGINLEEVADVR